VSRDRAAVVASAILEIVRDALAAWARRDHVDLAATRAEIEQILREEFDDAVREATSDLPTPD